MVATVSCAIFERIEDDFKQLAGNSNVLKHGNVGHINAEVLVVDIAILYL